MKYKAWYPELQYDNNQKIVYSNDNDIDNIMFDNMIKNMIENKV